VSDTKQQARARLRERTIQLQAEHDALERRPFDKAEHERHKEALRAHHQDLEELRNRPDDPPE
jgi:hypothetical protein